MNVKVRNAGATSLAMPPANRLSMDGRNFNISAVLAAQQPGIANNSFGTRLSPLF
jgi:hypothetical protein